MWVVQLDLRHGFVEDKVVPDLHAGDANALHLVPKVLGQPAGLPEAHQRSLLLQIHATLPTP